MHQMLNFPFQLIYNALLSCNFPKKKKKGKCQVKVKIIKISNNRSKRSEAHQWRRDERRVHTHCKKSNKQSFWLVLTYDPLEDRRINDVITDVTVWRHHLNAWRHQIRINGVTTKHGHLMFFIIKTNRFHVPIGPFSKRSQKCQNAEGTSVTLGCVCHFFRSYHINDLVLNRSTATWHLCVEYIQTSLVSSESSSLWQL